MATFTYIASYGASVQKAPRVRTVSFGDGYEQRLAYGINTNPREWNLTFNNKTVAQADLIDSFLTTANGVNNFDWTPPTGSAGKWVCRAWNRSIVDTNCHTITATFTEVFEP
jgi:phage-related protein